ncbi:MAG: DUF3750 domain-containing protein [Akkermansiaceae bacterium]|nr:DUF3750 domain-containing protein [Akkermansiaceae bacterium]
MLLLVDVLLLLTGCHSKQTIRPDSLIVVKDVQIPDSEPLLARFATHSWVDYRSDTRSPWRRIEIVNKTSGLQHHTIPDDVAHAGKRWGNRVRILSQSDGKKNPRFVSDIMRFAERYDASVYRVWPGPNSNSFAENLIRGVDGVSAVLDHNAVGKEHGFYVGKTAGGTGLELQTPLVGCALGLREGAELSLLGLSGGVALYPPVVKIPFLPRLPGR